jgi:hypothetical protein
LALIRQNRAFTIDGITESINNTAKHAIADGHVYNATSSLDNISFLNFSIVTEHDNTNVVGFEVESHTFDT